MARGWDVEFIARHSQEIMVIRRDEIVMGQVILETEEDKNRWLRAMKGINEPLEPESMSGRLINR